MCLMSEENLEIAHSVLSVGTSEFDNCPAILFLLFLPPRRPSVDQSNKYFGNPLSILST